MKAAKLVWKNFKSIHDSLDKYDKKRLKNAQTATKVEGFKLMGLLKEEIKEGSPGGRKFAPLTEIAKRLGRGRLNRNPLQRLAVAVRYKTGFEAGKMLFQVGFVNPTRGRPLSRSWLKIAKFQQEGGTITMSETLRETLASMGGRMKRKSRKLFLKKETRTFKVPKREIIDPFWNAYRNKAQRNIISNFERKMKGERI